MIISLNSLTEDVDNLAEDTTTEMDAIKEEMEDEEDDSSMNSPPLLPIRPTPTALFQPFLPHRQPEEKPQKSLAFSIDNILRPTFGPANSPPNGLFSPFFHSSLAAAAFAFAAASAASVVSSTTPLSPALSTTSSTSSTPTSPTASTIVKREQKINHNKPVDLSAKNNNNNNNNVISDNDLPSGLKTDEDCPPGMVRGPNGQLWPAWVFCTRYSDRPSSGPRSRRIKKPSTDGPGGGQPPITIGSGRGGDGGGGSSGNGAEKRPRTAFSAEQLARLKKEFDDNRYLTEERRKYLAVELGLNENQIKIWFQNKRAKIKKSTGQKGELAQMLMAQGLYNHSTIPVDDEDNPIY